MSIGYFTYVFSVFRNALYTACVLRINCAQIFFTFGKFCFLYARFTLRCLYYIILDCVTKRYFLNFVKRRTKLEPMSMVIEDGAGLIWGDRQVYNRLFKASSVSDINSREWCQTPSVRVRRKLLLSSQGSIRCMQFISVVKCIRKFRNLTLFMLMGMNYFNISNLKVW